MSDISYDLDKICILIENIDTKLQEVKLSYQDFGLEGSSSGLNSFVYSYVRLANFLEKYRVFVRSDILDVCNTINGFIKNDTATAQHFSGNQDNFNEFSLNISNSLKPFRSPNVSDPQDVSYSLGVSRSPLPSINTSSFRVSRIDTENMASKLSSSLLSLSARLIELKELIDVFSTDTSAMTGQCAEAMKKYWAEVHVPIVKAIDIALWKLNTHMMNYNAELYKLVSDDSYFVLTQSEMEAAITELTNIRASLAIIVDDVDSKIPSYSSLLGINVTIPNGRPMLDKFQQAATKIQTLVENVKNYETSKVSLVKGYIDEFVTNTSKVIDAVEVDKQLKDISSYKTGYFDNLRKEQKLTLDTDAKACERDEVRLILAFESTHPEYADAMNKFLDNDRDKNASLTIEMRLKIKYWAYTAPEPYRTIIMNGIINGDIHIGNLTMGTRPFEALVGLGSHNRPFSNTVNYSPDIIENKNMSTTWHEMGHAFDRIGGWCWWGSSDRITPFKTYNEAMGKDVSFYDAMEYDVYDNPNNPNSIYNLAQKCYADGITGNYENVVKAFKGKNVFLSKEDLNLYREICKRFMGGAYAYYGNSSSPNDGDNFGGVSDTYGGLTNNALVKNRDPQTGAPAKDPTTGKISYGAEYHPFPYFYKPEIIAPTEFYAEYFSAQVTGNAEKVALMRKYYPEACKVADEYSKYLANQ